RACLVSLRSVCFAEGVPRLGLTVLCVVVCAAALFCLAVLLHLERDWVRRFKLDLFIGISFGSAASFATTEAPPRLLSRRGRIRGCVYQPELVTLALCLRAKASPFWIMLLLVLGLRDHQVIQYCDDPPQHRPAVRKSPFRFCAAKQTFRRTQ